MAYCRTIRTYKCPECGGVVEVGEDTNVPDVEYHACTSCHYMVIPDE